ncbi:MAG: FKBP-type peptidyl-prolyl cis-trans isomerase [Ferruginibacter sp.]|nr:FKBP-type peptidyl-prolyl cis-trans isomerase [Cytophagales bacterium]
MRIASNSIALFTLATLLGLAGCVAEEDLTVQKKAENIVQIQEYLAANGLTAKDTLGLSFALTKPNPGGLPVKADDSVTVHHVTYTLDGRKIDSTSTLNNRPFVFWLNGREARVLPGFFAAVSLMREGEKATVLVPSDLAFKSYSDPRYFPAYAPLRFDLELIKIENEDRKIDRYLAASGLTGFETTASGLRFKRTQARPDSALAEVGKTASVRYTGRLLNGTQFDSNLTGTLFEVTIGSNSAQRPVRGFEEGLALMRKGEKATLVFSSSLGYGTQGRSPTILPYSPLVFDVEITDVK